MNKINKKQVKCTGSENSPISSELAVKVTLKKKKKDISEVFVHACSVGHRLKRKGGKSTTNL